MSASMIVPTALMSDSWPWIEFLAGLVVDEKLHRDDQEQQAADRPRVRQEKDFRQPQREDDAQEHRGPGTEHDPHAALAALERPARERDHHGVVAGKNDVDPDDLEQ